MYFLFMFYIYWLFSVQLYAPAKTKPKTVKLRDYTPEMIEALDDETLCSKVQYMASSKRYKYVPVKFMKAARERKVEYCAEIKDPRFKEGLFHRGLFGQ